MTIAPDPRREIELVRLSEDRYVVRAKVDGHTEAFMGFSRDELRRLMVKIEMLSQKEVLARIDDDMEAEA